MQSITPTRLKAASYAITRLLWARRLPTYVERVSTPPGIIEYKLKWTATLNVRDIRKHIPEIAMAIECSADVLRVVQREDGLFLQQSLKVTRPIRLSELLPPQGILKPYTALIGVDEQGNELGFNLASPNISHVGVFGTTGSGKTMLMRTIMASLAHSVTGPRDLGILYIDPKRRAEDSFANAIAKYLLWPQLYEASDAAACLAKLCSVMDAREIEPNPSPRILVVIDEFVDMVMLGGDSILAPTQRIAQKGREYGIHLLLGTQKPANEVIGPFLKSNLPLRLVGMVANSQDARVASGVSEAGAETLPGAGAFIAFPFRIRFQAALPDTQESWAGQQPDFETVESIKRAAGNAVVSQVKSDEPVKLNDLPTAPAVMLSANVEKAVRILTQDPNASKNRIAMEIFGWPASGQGRVNKVNSLISEALRWVPEDVRVVRSQKVLSNL